MLTEGTSGVRIIHFLMREFSRILTVIQRPSSLYGVWLIIFPPLTKFWWMPQKICKVYWLAAVYYATAGPLETKIRYTILPSLKSIQLKDWGCTISRVNINSEYVEIKCQLDATEVFIADLIACSTCFGHHCAHHQELKSIIQWLLPVVFRVVLCCVSNHCIILLSSWWWA